MEILLFSVCMRFSKESYSKKSGNMETVKNISMRDYLFDTLQEKCIILLLFSLLSNIERYFVCRLYKDINWVSPTINKCPSSTTLHQY